MKDPESVALQSQKEDQCLPGLEEGEGVQGLSGGGEVIKYFEIT